MRLTAWLPVLALLAVLPGCQSQVTQGGAVGVQRQQLMLVSAREVERMSAQHYADTLAEARKKGVLNTDRALHARLQRIAARLKPHTAVFRADALAWQWEVNVIEQDTLNAYCMAGGKIMFYSGIVRKLALTDDEIAAIMGHEIAHALREHSREQVSRARLQGLGLSLLAQSGKVSEQTVDLTGQLVTLALQLPNSREAEVESDRIGLELMARAGYQPRAAVTLWQKMNSHNSGGPPQFLSTHPSSVNRIRDLEALLPRVMPLYEAARKG
jgi:predicted Zn-dependent protease